MDDDAQHHAVDLYDTLNVLAPFQTFILLVGASDLHVVVLGIPGAVTEEKLRFDVAPEAHRIASAFVRT
jgi:hypothetical protein